ncbi:MAG: 5'/3'-nucleotidase SurE [Gammaproteobacteria bacterium]|nr:5'/3'-nucleotidase SurE [Gammaproteobacteria bacterium]
MSKVLLRTAALLAIMFGITFSVAANQRALTIMLTNDDGYRAPGLLALRDALRGAGHHVVIVAPRTDQSGSSVKISTTPVGVVEEASDTWVVDGSPADAAGVGLDMVFASKAPDLVVSGANRGQNLGTTTNLSGTVGAAVFSAMHAVPAMAVSVGMELAERAAGFPSTVAAYPAAAKFVTQLIAELAASAQGGVLLPPRTLLNLNYPARAEPAIKGVRWANVGVLGGMHFAYKSAPAHRAQLSYGPETVVEPDPAHADTALFKQGYITLSVLDVSWQAPHDLVDEVTARLKAVAPR